jgi:hypothetical protein
MIVSTVLWESRRDEPIVAKVAVAGDFLPAGCIELPSAGWIAAAKPLSPVFDDVHTTFANLECVLDPRGLSPRTLSGLGQIVSAPSRSLDYLAAIRALPVGIANNHICDFGDEGMFRTRKAISHAGLVPLGFAKSRRDSPETFVWHGPEEIRVGFWAAARASHDLAARDRPGVEPATLERASEAHRQLKNLGASFSIALVHAGHLRTCRPDPSDLRLLGGVAKRGFDLVAASHSHRISGAKLLPSSSRAASFCFYGIGSLASGYVDSEREREGLIVVAGFHSDGALARVEVRPLAIALNGFGEIPSPLAAHLLLDRFRDLSREISDGSSTRLFYQDISRGFARLYLRDASAAFRQSGVRGLIRKAGRVRVKHLRGAVRGLLK